MTNSRIEDWQTPTGWRVRRDIALAEQAYADGWWTSETCAAHLDRIAVEDPARVLLVERDIEVTAARLRDQAQLMARAMLSRFAPGSVVSFMLPNWHEAATIYMAATYAGMVAHPILPSLRDHDLRFMLDDVGAKMIFIPAEFRGHDYAAMLTRVVEAIDNPPQVVVLRGEAGAHIGYDDLLAEAHDGALPDVSPDDVRMVMYTSGTTGRPKGVMHTHNSLHALLRQIGEHWHVEQGDSFLVPSPISHIGGSIYAFEMPLLLGTTAVLMEHWDPREAVAIMADRGITHMAGATPFLQMLLAAAREAGTNLPALKVFICGGASVPPSLVCDARDYFAKAAVSRVYGSTEVPVTTVGVIDRDDIVHASQTDGRPGIADVILGEAQEIRARGPQMFMGYTHAEDEANAFDADGYYRTGDQGEWIDGNHLVVTGRIKDLIIRNGENIAPKEIEDLLVGHDDIAEIAIVGIPDAKTGERAVAVIVPSGHAMPDVASLAEHLASHGVAKFKYPERVELRNALPKNDAGKVLKVQLRAELSEPTA